MSRNPFTHVAKERRWHLTRHHRGCPASQHTLVLRVTFCMAGNVQGVWGGGGFRGGDGVWGGGGAWGGGGVWELFPTALMRWRRERVERVPEAQTHDTNDETGRAPPHEASAVTCVAARQAKQAMQAPNLDYEYFFSNSSSKAGPYLDNQSRVDLRHAVDAVSPEYFDDLGGPCRLKSIKR